LTLRAKDCRSGDVLDEEQVQAAKKEDVLNALSQIASKFRTRVGESLTTVEKHDTPLAEATTPSLEALKSYSTALKVLFSTGSSAALPLFQRAIEIDPKFAAAHAYVGRMYGDLGETALSAESTSEAYQLRDRASEPEKFFITASYDMQVTGNMEKAEQTCELWVQTYPREMMPHSFLSGIVVPVLGKYERAEEEGQKTIRLNPDFAIGYSVLAFSYAYLDRFGDAGNVLQKASERKLEIPDFLIQRYDIAFLKGDAAGMQREVALAWGKTRVLDWISDHEAFALAYSGRLREARAMSRAAVDLAQQDGQRERASLYEAAAALRESLFGNTLAARQQADAALELSRARDTEYGAAVALALAGDLSNAQKLANDLEKRFPEDTSVRFSYLPTLRALFELNRGEASQAIKSLDISATNELRAPTSSFFGFFGALYPIYVRGQAYLAVHQGANAAAEFQKIVDHRGIVVSDPIGALAHLQLGRAYTLSGDKTKAKSAYQDFLMLWKDADPDIPILKQAQAEHANLN
jgi:tetratricopeptide (TPR) repeat protein